MALNTINQTKPNVYLFQQSDLITKYKKEIMFLKSPIDKQYWFPISYAYNIEPITACYLRWLDIEIER